MDNVAFTFAGAAAGWWFSSTIDVILFYILHPSVCKAVATHYATAAIDAVSRPFFSQSRCGDFSVINLKWMDSLEKGMYTLNTAKPRDIVRESARCNKDRFLVAHVRHPVSGNFVIFVTSQCDPLRPAWPFNTDEPAPCDREDITAMTVRFKQSNSQHSMTSWIQQTQGLQAHFGGSIITMRDLARVWLETQNEQVRADFHESDATFETKTIDGIVQCREHQTLLELDDALRAQSASE